MKNEIENMINLYFDGELEKGKEPMLFTLLSQDEEARNYFKQLHLIKSNMQISNEEFPLKLDEKILRTIGRTKSMRLFKITDYKIFDTVVYAAVVVFIFLSIFFYSKSEEYKVQFFDLSREVKKQNEQLQLLINTLPQVNVEGSYVRIKEVIVKPQI